MKRIERCMLVLLLGVASAISCKDEQDTTGVSEPLLPSAGVTAAQQDRVEELIEALYPRPGLYTAAMNRWRNIRRQLARGREDAARDQVFAFVEDAISLMEEGQLIPNASEEPRLDELNELTHLLFTFVGFDPETLPELDQEFLDSEDTGTGPVTPADGGEIITENGWAKVYVAPGDAEEPSFITIDLLPEPECDFAGALTTTLGCWDINQYGGGEFEHIVEVCVADPGPPEEPGGMTDQEYYIDLRLHMQEDAGSEPVALPLVNSTLDCSDFPVGEEPSLASRPGGDSTIWASIRSRVADLLLPDPLAAFWRQYRRPPRGLGGLSGSFTWYFGALPVDEEEDYESLPVGSGGAQSWEIVDPGTTAFLCTAADPGDCPEGSVTEVEVSAVLTEDATIDPDPWWKVFFYYKPAGAPGPLSFFDSTSVFSETDNGTNRFSTWEGTLSGSHPELSEGPIEVFAVGATDPADGEEIFATELASYIEVVGEVPSGLYSTAFVNGVPSTTVSRGEAVSVPVILDMTPLSPDGDLGSAQFELSYDEAFLEFNSTESSLDGILVANGTTPGKVAVAFAHTESQGSSAFTLVTIHFTVQGDAPTGSTALTLSYSAAPSDTDLVKYPMPVVKGGTMTVNP
ncbi:MAG: cohesin domain-containing protein [Gemmatimonadota bacterium]|jgi:hypothetical protein